MKDDVINNTIIQVRCPDQRGYKPSHPWYYKLGGTVQKPKQILAAVKKSGYKGYKVECIERADNKREPECSSALRVIRQSSLKDMWSDLECYRHLVRQYHEYCQIDKAVREKRSQFAPIYARA